MYVFGAQIQASRASNLPAIEAPYWLNTPDLGN